MTAEALRALADAAEALARLAREAANDDHHDPIELLPLREAARVAGTSRRVLRDAIRSNQLAAFGRQRDRTVRRADLLQWIESRRVPAIAGPDDADLDRRIARIAKARRKKASR